MAGTSYINDQLPVRDFNKHDFFSDLCKECIKVEGSNKMQDVGLKVHFIRNLLICNSVLPQTGEVDDEKPDTMRLPRKILHRFK